MTKCARRCASGESTLTQKNDMKLDAWASDKKKKRHTTKNCLECGKKMDGLSGMRRVCSPQCADIRMSRQRSEYAKRRSSGLVEFVNHDEESTIRDGRIKDKPAAFREAAETRVLLSEFDAIAARRKPAGPATWWR